MWAHEGGWSTSRSAPPEHWWRSSCSSRCSGGAARMIRRHEFALRAERRIRGCRPPGWRRSSNSSDDAIVSKDLDGMIRVVNPHAERMFGYPAAEAVGKHISLIVSGRSAGPRERCAGAAAAGREGRSLRNGEDDQGRRCLIISRRCRRSGTPRDGLSGLPKVARYHRAAAGGRPTERCCSRANPLGPLRPGGAGQPPQRRISGDAPTESAHAAQCGAGVGRTSSGRLLLPKRPWGEGLAVIESNARTQSQLIADLLDMSRIISGRCGWMCRLSRSRS